LRILEEAVDIWRVLEERWRVTAARAIEERGVFTVALSGGNTPVGFYCYLSRREQLPWEGTEIFQVDERYVPRESGENNFSMIRSSLLESRRVNPRGVHSVETDAEDAAAAAERYETDLQAFFGKEREERPSFDLVLLGIGEDGHTASLFPEGPELREERKWVTVARPACAEQARITVTLPVLNRSRNAVFVATGKKKAPMVRRVWEGGADAAVPASLVRPRESLAIFVDRKAGACP
jgi:6-phosphogluconolactonase